MDSTAWWLEVPADHHYSQREEGDDRDGTDLAERAGQYQSVLGRPFNRDSSQLVLRRMNGKGVSAVATHRV